MIKSYPLKTKCASESSIAMRLKSESKKLSMTRKRGSYENATSTYNYVIYYINPT